MKKNTLFLLFSFLLLPTLSWTQTVYWTERGNGIKSFDGTTTSTLVSSIHEHVGISIDETNNEMYWCTAQSGEIRKADIDGSNQSTVLATGSFYITLDVPNNKMYWTIFGSGEVKRADLDGTNVQTIASGQSSPAGITLDLVNNKVYWTESNSNHINRADLDGSNFEDITPSNATDPWGLALDIPNNRMYWSNQSNGNIGRADLDGSNSSIIVSGLGATNPSGVALDLSVGKVYWIEFSGTRISRADLDGSNQELSYITGVSTSSESLVIVPATASIPSCSILSSPADGATGVAIDADLSWSANADATGYKLKIGTSSGAGDFLAETDLNNVTTYDPATDFAANTTYYVILTAYNATGNVTGCTETTFTTGTPINVTWTDGQAADLVIGQPNLTSNTADNGGIGATTLDGCSGIAIDHTNGKMYVADEDNHRVLRYAYPITSNQPAAEVVFGQPNFTSSTDATTQAGMGFPAGVAVDANGTLWVADSENSRVLRFDNAHTINSNGPNADGVLG